MMYPIDTLECIRADKVQNVLRNDLDEVLKWLQSKFHQSGQRIVSVLDSRQFDTETTRRWIYSKNICLSSPNNLYK